MPPAPKPLNTVTERLRLGDVRLLDLNARYMRHETFQRLVANIKADGCLTQTPFAVYDQGAKKPPLVLSGNHRVKAGIEALGPDHEDWFITTRDKLPNARRLAIQLSHNAVVGEDDPAVLAQLYEQIDSVDWREFAGLDDATLDLMEKVSPVPMGEAHLEFAVIALSFLPDEADDLTAALDRAQAVASDERWAARYADYDRFLDALDVVSRSYGIKNTALAVRLVVDLALANIDQAAAGFLDPDTGDVKHNGWVPLWTLFGGDAMPADAAAVVKRALDRARSTGDLPTGTPAVRALELWAADYLAGPG